MPDPSSITHFRYNLQIIITVMPLPDNHFKIILVGDCRVGKTSFLKYIVNKKSSTSAMQNVPPTIGVEYTPIKLRVRGQETKVKLFDTSGAQKYKAITKSYYRKCQGAIVVFDLTDRQSFFNLENWLQQIDRNSSTHINKVIVANKMDMVESGEKERVISESDLIDFCLKHSLTYKYTSALTGLNIQESLIEVIEKIFDDSLVGNNHDMASQSWQNNQDLSILPIDPKKAKLEEQNLSSCPKCC